MLKNSLFYHHCDDTETFCEVRNQILLLKLNRPIAAVPTLNRTFSRKHNQPSRSANRAPTSCAVPWGHRQAAGSRPKGALAAALAPSTRGS